MGDAGVDSTQGASSQAWVPSTPLGRTHPAAEGAAQFVVFETLRPFVRGVWLVPTPERRAGDIAPDQLGSGVGMARHADAPKDVKGLRQHGECGGCVPRHILAQEVSFQT